MKWINDIRDFSIFVQIAAVEFVQLDEFHRMISSLPRYCKQYSGIQHREINNTVSMENSDGIGIQG